MRILSFKDPKLTNASTSYASTYRLVAIDGGDTATLMIHSQESGLEYVSALISEATASTGIRWAIVGAAEFSKST